MTVLGLHEVLHAFSALTGDIIIDTICT